MISIRGCVFETSNSSSSGSHSVSIKRRYSNNYDDRLNISNNVLSILCGQYGSDPNSFNTLQGKLEYVVTMAMQRIIYSNAELLDFVEALALEDELLDEPNINFYTEEDKDITTIIGCVKDFLGEESFNSVIYYDWAVCYVDHESCFYSQ